MWSLDEINTLNRQTLQRQAQQYRLEAEARHARRDRAAAHVRGHVLVWLWRRLSGAAAQVARVRGQFERKNSIEPC